MGLIGCQSIQNPQSLEKNEDLAGELRYYEAEDFQTLNWKLDWKSRYPNRLILRTDPNVHSGWYLKFDLPETLIEKDPLNRIVLTLHRKHHTKPEVFTFDCTQQSISQKTIMLGLTTPDWQFDEPCIHAWNIKLISSDNKTLAESKSYGWSYR